MDNKEMTIEIIDKQINELKAERARLEAKEKEKEATQRKADLDEIKEKIALFNSKYGTEYTLTTASNLTIGRFMGLGW